jgi:hypothetical protein
LKKLALSLSKLLNNITWKSTDAQVPKKIMIL